MFQKEEKFTKVNKHFSNEKQYNFWKDGFISIPLKFDQKKQNFLNNLINIYENYRTSKDFFIKEKYKSSEQYDFCGNIEDLDFCVKFLRDIKIIEEMNFICCSNLILTNVTIRINRNLSSTKFWGDHRDTSILKDKSIKGNVPPVKNLIYYPNLNPEEIEDQLKIWNGSHRKMFIGIFDRIINSFGKKTIIKSNTNSMILFDGAIKHAIANSKNSKGNLRLIFGFLDINQLHKGIVHQDRIKRWNKILNEN